MREEKTEVTAYSGYRGEESPKTFIRQGKNITVVEILKRWIEEEAWNRKRRRFFEVRGSDDAIHRIVYDEESLQWFYVRKD
jgi:hypothetical protein